MGCWAYQTSMAVKATLCEGVKGQGACHLFVKKANFDKDLNNWDTAAVTDFFEMFSYASSFDGDVSVWNTGKVATASEMLGRGT